MKIKKGIIFIVALFCAFHLQAQTHSIRGIVTAFDSIQLVGAEIRVKSSGEIFKTDSAGFFTAVCKAPDKIKISAEGFSPKTLKIEDKIKVVAVNLKLKSGDKNREYALGYTKVSDKDRFNALSRLDKDDIDFAKYNNVYELISGRFPGVQVMKNGAIIIRGMGSFSLNNSALIVIDGIPYQSSNILNSIHPTQIKSINVLKGGKSSMYGAQGSNGVLVIETKQGNENNSQ